MEWCCARIRTAGHPRSRGERCPSDRKRDQSSGSSPRARRKVSSAAGGLQPLRVIPASAEKDTLGRWPDRRFASHPRAGGERRNMPVTPERKNGSSPRVIPARAEKGRRLTCLPAAAASHPRTRGERGGVVLCHDTHSGSSPHRRRKNHVVVDHFPKVRVIPAQAEKGHNRRRRGCRSRGDPRSRGETFTKPANMAAVCGASP